MTRSEKNSMAKRIQAARLILGILASIAGLILLQFDEYSALALAFIVFLFVISLWYDQIWGIYIIQGCILTFKMVVLSNQPPGQSQILFAGDLAFSLVFILFSAICFRYFEIAYYGHAFCEPESNKSKINPSRFPKLARGRWLMIPISVFLALALLRMLPGGNWYRVDYWILPAPGRTIFVLGTLFLIWFVGRSLIQLISRATMTQEQADLICRGNYLRSTWYELCGIEKRLAKARIRESKVE